MQIVLREFSVTKRAAVVISRGHYNESRNIVVEVTDDAVTGWGEACEFSIGQLHQPFATLKADLERAITLLTNCSAWDRKHAEQILTTAKIGPAARAGIDLALYDWWGKRLGQPVWKLLGLPCASACPTSVTIGINTPEGAIARVGQWQALGTIRILKVKLGSPAGIAADQSMFSAIQTVWPQGEPISVDANGGWSLDNAISMSHWLAERGVDHIEQPLAMGDEANLAPLHAEGPLPIFLDESCQSAADVARYAPVVSGVNIKLAKCGGIGEALRMIHTARAHSLKLMLGCYTNTTLGNTPAAHLGSLVDYIDLDSHLNLKDDPFQGATFGDGFLKLNSLPGFGVLRAQPSAL